MRRRTSARLSIAIASSMLGLAAHAQTASDTVKIGVLTDMSGPYSGMGGPGSLVAAKMAVDDCLKAECKGLKVDIVYADHQNKADIGSSKAREWIDREKVEAIVDLTNSSVALAVQKLIKEKGAIAMYSGPATTLLTSQGLKSWYFLTVDYAFGHSLERDASAVIKNGGGSVVGAVRFPLNSADLSSFLIQAGTSKSQVVAVAASGQDAVTAVKQARDFGVGTGAQRLVALNLFLTDVHALGLPVAQGLTFTDGYYWDFDNETRAFASRFEALHKGNKPTMVQAGVYSSTYHFLKARAAAKTSDWKTVAKTMREIPIKDPVMKNASIRADGRVIHDMFLYQVKTPAESKGAWDYLKLITTIPAQQAFKPADPTTCPLVKG